MNQKNIVILYSQLNSFGGIEQLFLDLADSLIKKKINILIVCYENRLIFQKFRKNIKVIKYKKNKNIIKTSFNLKKKVEKLNYKGQILAYDYQSIIYCYLSKVNDYNCHLTDPPSLLEIDQLKKKNTSSQLKELTKKYLIKKSLKKATKVITMCKINQREFQKIYGLRPLVVYQGTSLKKTKLTKTKTYNKKNINLLSIARLERNKNIEWILYLVKKIVSDNKKNNQKVSLNIIGEGTLDKKLRGLTKKLQIERHVNFLGYVSNRKKINFLKKTTINLIPAKQGYGIPALESVFLGIPTIINSASRISEILKNKEIIKITKNNKKNFIEVSFNFIKLFNSKKKLKIEIDDLPTSSNWSFNISKLCKWI